MSFPVSTLSSTTFPSPLSSLSPSPAATILPVSSFPTINAASSIVATSVAAAAETAMVTIADSDSRPGANGGECQLLGEASIFIQAALGGLALLSLVYKRWRERPRRPWKIWFFDVSKQVLGSVLLHIANLLMSMLSSGQFEITPKSNNGAYSANPCSFYLLNLAIDLCPWIVQVGDWALKWTKGNKTVQVFFVMLLFPVIMNALQYYIIDGFIKNQKAAEPGVDHNEESSDEDQRTRRPRAAGSDEQDRQDEDEALPAETEVASDIEDKPLLGNGVTKLKINPKLLEEYDPTTDGESSPAPSEIRRRNSPGGTQIMEGRDHTARRSS
ncbi:MAG: hypothetical protein Q9208_000685 [Pyrenodesmia sp. 3 TL-2023]